MPRRKKIKATRIISYSENEDGEYVYDIVTGARGRKPVLNTLNKRIVGKHEMDELFCDWN